MTEEQQRTAIAEACGWSEFGRKVKFANTGNSFAQREYWVDGGKEPETGFHKELPDYPNDLNAMHKAWSILGAEQRVEFEAHLYDIIVGLGEFHSSEDRPYITNATAAQRAEAFLKTIGKWEDGN